MELVQQLKKDGIGKGLCTPWQRKLRPGMSMKAMVGLFIKGIDFCISENYPTLEFIRMNFKGHCEEYGVFVDDDVKVEKNQQDIVLNGNCMAFMKYDGYSVSRIYARHETKAAIDASGHAILTIDAFDNTELFVGTSGGAKVLVNLYGNAHVECVGMGINVRFMNKETY